MRKIDADELIKTIEKVCFSPEWARFRVDFGSNGERDYIINEIVNAPTIEERPTGEWIPVSERLPKERTAVLIWCPERKNIYCACLEENQWWVFGAYFQKVDSEVIAWMPLPKPYKKGE